MKRSDELKQKRATIEGKIEPLSKKAADEITAEERTTLEGYYRELEDLNGQIDLQIKNEQFEANRAARNGEQLSEGDKKDIQRFSFARAIRLLSDNKSLDGIEAEVGIEGSNERKNLGLEVKGFAVPMSVLRNVRASAGQNVATPADGGLLVRDEAFVFIEALQNALVLQGLGVVVLPGLVGNLPLLKGGAFTANWLAEGEAVEIGKEAFTKVTMTPKNLVCAGAISRQTLIQTAGVAEMLVRTALINSIAQGLQLAAINGNGANGQPKGILNYDGVGSVVGGINGSAPTWANIIDLETKIGDANAIGQLSYLTNSKVKGYLKQTLKNANVAGYIWEGDQMNGARSAVTNAVPSNLVKGESNNCSAIISGIFSEMFMGMWGGLDIIVDPYTLAAQGDVRIINNQFADVALRNPGAFAVMKDAKVS